MQHNWWIAALELAGVWSREQAEHVSTEIKTAIHREKYPDAYNDLKDILAKAEGLFGVGSITNIESEITALKSMIKILMEQLAAKVEGEGEKVVPAVTNVKKPLAKESKTS